MFLKFNWFPIVWTLCVIGIHAIPGQELPVPYWDLFEFDKIVHLIIFMILSFSWANGFFKQSASYKLKVHGIKLILVFTLILGLVLELMQNAIFVNRYFQWPDVIADGIGSILGIGMFYAIYGSILKYT
ncbi:MAG: VanZ family protein [Bacteroidia bacterium]